VTTAVIFAGGPPPPSSVVNRLPDDALIVAADGGLDHARALGLVPRFLVGDLDSVSADGLRWAEAQGVLIDQHPTDKDATDLELAMSAAAHVADELVIVDGGEGRLDQSLGNLMLLASPRFSGVKVRALVGTAHVVVVRGHRTLMGNPGDLVSLVAVGEPAEGVTTKGLRWSLHEASLVPGSSLGISNEMLDVEATVSVEFGALLAIQP
jgi:thiamine pyrophosphokinase